MTGALVVGALGIVSARADFPGDCLAYQHQHQLTSGNDVAQYNNDDQCVDALGGDDLVILNLGGGSNLVWGDGGNDRLQGSISGDTLKGGAGSDTLYGLGGADTLVGGGDTDTFYDGVNPSGNGDAIYGTSGSGDTLYHCTGTGSHSNSDYIDSSVDNVFNSPNYC